MSWINVKSLAAIAVAALLAGATTYWAQKQKVDRLQSQMDNEWKIAASPVDYSSSPDWAKTGQIKTFAP